MLPLILVLAAWGDLRPDGPPARRGPPPKTSQRREALDELQALLGQWQKERSDFSREVALQQRAELRLEASREHRDDPAAAVKEIEVKRGTGKSGRGKVIEFAPREKLEVDLEQAEADAEARQAACRKDPVKCEADRKKRARLELADEAFEAAIEVNFEKRRAKIEAEAVKMQAELMAARQSEANRQAKKLGGAVDDEGNFVDDDLKAEPPPILPTSH